MSYLNPEPRPVSGEDRNAVVDIDGFVRHEPDRAVVKEVKVQIDRLNVDVVQVKEVI